MNDRPPADPQREAKPQVPTPGAVPPRSAAAQSTSHPARQAERRKPAGPSRAQPAVPGAAGSAAKPVAALRRRPAAVGRGR